MKTNRNIVVLDNGGKSFDRYTIINRKTSEIFGASENPYHPQGLGQYCGELNKSQTNQTEKRNRLEVRIFLRDSKHLGKRVKDISTLPADVQRYINQIISE